MLRTVRRFGWLRSSLVFATALMLLSFGKPTWGQATPPPKLRITHIDSSGFPNVAVYGVVDDFAGDIAELPATLREDSVAVDSLQDGGMQLVGIQVALVLDSSTTVLRPGMTGDPRHVEVGQAARRLVQLGLLSAETDWLTSIAFNAQKEIDALASWSQDHQAVADSLYIYKPESIGVTPLYDLLFFTLKQFDDAALPPGQARSIVVFSDGIDVVSTTGLQDAVKLAADKHVRIYPVLIGPETAATRKNLEYLSTITGGQYYHLSSIENMDGLWNHIARGQRQRRLTYRSQQAQPRQVTMGLTLPDGRALSAEGVIPAISLQPVEVVITAPAADILVERKSPTYDMALNQIEPRAIEVQLAFHWPDGRQRALRQVTVQIGGVTEVLTTGPFDAAIPISIADLESGQQTIQAAAVDEVGLEGKAQPLPFTVTVIRPPAPTPTPDATLVAQATQAEVVAATATVGAQVASETISRTNVALTESESLVDDLTQWRQTLTLTTIGGMAFGVIMLGFAIYVLSNRDRRRQATQIITGTIAAATEPFRPRGARGGGGEPRAQLTLVDDGGTPTMPAMIPLSRGGVRLGRDPAVVSIPLPDRRISKLHCRIVEDGASGGYRILDEGSMSGTYVNDQEVEMSGQPLQPGDLIGIGPVQYRYEIVGATPRVSNVTEPMSKPFDREDNTDPYIRTPPANRS